MADGGASTFIFLATALLVSGAVSAVLISQYGDITSAMEQERRENDERIRKHRLTMLETYLM